jgi:2-C-methyl-D-erythritol 4-phosphate cytidylyltransferase
MYEGKRTSAVIVAGGTGKRMNSPVPKQFLDLAGKPLIIHTIEKFDNNDMVDYIVIVCHGDFIKRLERLLNEYGFSKAAKITPGGVTRQESSFNGLMACPEDTELVLIHDAVRPFVDERLIESTLQAADSWGAATVAVDINDTVVLEKNGYIESIPDRTQLKRVQTPQGFRYQDILEAHRKAALSSHRSFTDDCGIMLNSGSRVRIIKGSSRNNKITRPLDLKNAANYFC